MLVAHSISNSTVMPRSVAIFCQPSSHPPGSWIFSRSDLPRPPVRPVGSVGDGDRVLGQIRVLLEGGLDRLVELGLVDGGVGAVQYLAW